MAGWFVERHGDLLGPYSLEQVQGMAGSGQLRTSDRVVKEGTSQLLAPRAMLDIAPEQTAAVAAPRPVAISSGPVPAAPPRFRAWRWLAVGTSLLVLVALLFAFI